MRSRSSFLWAPGDNFWVRRGMIPSVLLTPEVVSPKSLPGAGDTLTLHGEACGVGEVTLLLQTRRLGELLPWPAGASGAEGTMSSVLKRWPRG